MAKNKFATRALNSKDEQILVTMELNITNMEVNIHTFPIATKADKEVDDMISKWMAGESIIFPENTTEFKRNFTDESLLPDEIKVDGISVAIRQLQNEWSYLLLNAKLFEQFNTELDILKQKAGEIKAFSHELFDEAKEFWEKILEYKKEREISQEKLNYFKEEINGVFDHLKNLKESMMKEKDEFSEKLKTDFVTSLQAIESKLDESGVHFKSLMDELREMQTKLRSEDVKRDIKNILFDNIQATFEKVKVKRDAILGSAQNARLEGLKKVLDRMQKSLDMDKKDLEYNMKKLAVVNNKLELQLREAKINVLKDRILSKEDKLADISKTLGKISKKATVIKDNLKEEIKEVREDFTENAQDVIPEVKEDVKEGVHTIGDVFENLLEKFEEAAGDVKKPKARVKKEPKLEQDAPSEE